MSLTNNFLFMTEVKPTVQSDVDILTGLSDLEAQAGEAAAQQQKSLITALALKRQEDALLKVQAQQAALLSQHEQQLSALVQRQLQRQQQMIRQQQQIETHIQVTLMKHYLYASFYFLTISLSRFFVTYFLNFSGSYGPTASNTPNHIAHYAVEY